MSQPAVRILVLIITTILLQLSLGFGPVAEARIEDADAGLQNGAHSGQTFNNPTYRRDYQNPYAMHMEGHEGIIRIRLTRNISFPDQYYRTAPLVSYFGVLGVGTPKKHFNVVFDTGVSDSWLPYSNWYLPLANNLHYSNGYKCGDSKTCNKGDKDLKILYRGTRLSGDTYEDNFMLYEDATKDQVESPLIIDSVEFRQGFLGVDDTSDEQFRYVPYDGVIGLAPMDQSKSGMNVLLSLLQAVDRQQGYQYNQHRMMFSFWFNPNQQASHGGELVLGGVDPSKISSNFQFHRTSGWTDWRLSMSSVRFGSKVISCQDRCAAIFDTGANSIVGPKDDVEAIYSNLGVHKDQNSDLVIVNCGDIDSFPELTFHFDNQPYLILPRHYVRMFNYKGGIVCYMAIRPWDRPDWLMGTTFIGAYYTVFDYENRQIGFATPRQSYMEP